MAGLTDHTDPQIHNKSNFRSLYAIDSANV
jgi:hypothetical protein